MQFVTVFLMITCLSGRGAETANVSCFKHKIDSGSGLVNMVVGLREFLKHYVQSWNEISWNSFVILVLEWKQHLPFKQISAIQSQDYRPMSVIAGLSGNKHIHHWILYIHEINPFWDQTLLNIFISMEIILK